MVDRTRRACYNNYTYAGSFFCAVRACYPAGAIRGPLQREAIALHPDKPGRAGKRRQGFACGRKFIEEVPLCAFE